VAKLGAAQYNLVYCKIKIKVFINEDSNLFVEYSDRDDYVIVLSPIVELVNITF
jgi:hypothetical protein